MKPSFKNWCEKQATDWRYRLGLRAYDPLPANRLAVAFSAELIPPDKLEGAPPEAVELFLTADPSTWSAMILRAQPLVIMYNPNHSAARYESNIMHELAHVILEHQPIQINTSLWKREYRQKDEAEATYLGGCLQIPKRGLDWCLQKKMTNDQIANHFGASLEMVQYRRNMTGR